jgi:hypothetical protein
MDTNQENGKFTMMTDILVLSTSDGEQPQKEIDIKIPTHMITDNNNVVVLASKYLNEIKDQISARKEKSNSKDY